MAVYNWRDRTARPRSARFFDAATGEHVPGVFYWDEDTNHVGRYQKTADGAMLVVDPSGRPIEVWEFRSLRVEWKGEADTPHVVG